MNRTISAAVLLFAACCGCCACDSSCDYLPPVLDGPYSAAGMRSGGATAAEYAAPTIMEGEPYTPSIQSEPITPSMQSEPITPSPEVVVE